MPRSKDSKKSSSKELEDLMLEKVVDALKSPALNGGFDTLLHKVDNIERTQILTTKHIDELCKVQDQLTKAIDRMTNSIYDPDDGLYARQKSSEAASTAMLVELKSWQENVVKEAMRNNRDDEKLHEKVVLYEEKTRSNEAKIDQIIKYHNVVKSGSKWILAALIGGLITWFFRHLGGF